MYEGPDIGKAVTAVQAAERRKLAIPPAVREAAAVRGAVFTALHQPAPEPPTLPDTASAVEGVIAGYAAALHAHTITANAADRFQTEADVRYTQAVRAAIPGWIDGLQKEFETLVGVVAKAAAKLPGDLDLLDPERLDWTHLAHMAAYTKAESAVVQLEQLVSDRAAIVQVAGGDGGRDNALFAVAYFPQPTVQRVMDDDWQQLHPALAKWRELRSRPVVRWVYLVRQQELTLSLATSGQARERAATVDLWRNAGHARRSALSPRGAEALVGQVLAAA